MPPAYLSFLLGTGDTDQPRAAAVARALRVGLTVSAGFLVVFGLAGIALTAGARWLTTAIPLAALAVGIVLAVLGAVMLTGRSVPVRLPSVARAGTGPYLNASPRAPSPLPGEAVVAPGRDSRRGVRL